MTTLPFADERPLFDPSTLESWPAWNTVRSSILETQTGAEVLRSEPVVAKARPALASAFVPMFHDLASQHLAARNAWHRHGNVPFSQQGNPERHRTELLEKRERSRTIASHLVANVTLALHAGLFDLVIDTLARPVQAPDEPTVFPSSSSRHGGRTGPGPSHIPVWEMLDGPDIGVLVVQAALGHAPFQATPSQVQARLTRLTKTWAGQEFWGNWKSHLRAFPNPSHHLWCNQLAETMGWQIARLTRRPSLTGLCAAMFERLVDSQSMGDTSAPWSEVGSALLKSIQASAPRFGKVTGPAAQALLATLPVNAWLVIAQQAPLTGSLGQWLDSHLVPIAQRDPDGLAAETLCLNAWAGLHQDRILHLEAQVPGIHRRHLDRLTQSTQLFDLVDPCTTPHAQWARPFLEAAGVVPPGSETFDLGSWVTRNPADALPVFHALFNQMEAQMLRASLASGNDHEGVVQASPRSRRL